MDWDFFLPSPNAATKSAKLGRFFKRLCIRARRPTFGLLEARDMRSAFRWKGCGDDSSCANAVNRTAILPESAPTAMLLLAIEYVGLFRRQRSRFSRPASFRRFCSNVFSCAILISSLVVAIVIPSAAPAQTLLYSDNFNTDTSADYNTFMTAGVVAGPTGDATWAYDYGAAPGSGGLSMPAAPHTTDGTTKGLRLRTDNLQNSASAAVVGATEVVTKNLALPSQYLIQVDVWDNYIGGTSLAASGSNGTTGAAIGIGSAGTNLQYINANDGLMFEAFGDNGGGANQAYRVYTDNVHPNPTTKQYWAAGNTATSASFSDPYYTSRFPSVSAPAGQSAFAPATQGGSTAAGTLGFAWHTWTILNDGTNVTWAIDGSTIAKVPTADYTAAGSQVQLGNDDTGVTGNTAANNQLFNAHIFDNLQIFAAARTWSAASPGDLLSGANWSGGTAPNSTDATATISAQPTNSGNLTLNGTMTLGKLDYQNSQDRAIAGSGMLNLATSTGTPEIAVGGTSNLSIISVHDIASTQGFTKTGSGTLTFGGSYGITGPISITDGKLSVTATTNALNGQGSSYAISNGATLEDRETGAASSTSRTLNLGSGGGTVSVTNSGTTVTWNGAISGSGGLTKTGPGVITLTAANTYSGGTTIANGTLLANNGSGSATGSGPITVVTGGQLGGTGTVAGSVTLAGGALAPGNGIGTLNVNHDVTFASSSRLIYEINQTSADLVNINGNLNIDPTATVAFTDSGQGFISPGTKFSIASYSGAWNGNGFNAHLNNHPFFLNGQGFLIKYDDTTAGANQGGGAFNKFLTITATPLDGRLAVTGAPGVADAAKPGPWVNNFGVATGTGSGGAVRWSGSNNATSQLEPFTVGNLASYAITDSGVVVGTSYSDSLGDRAVRWDVGSTVPTELANVGTEYGQTGALAANDSGGIVGFADNSQGARSAIRWQAGSGTPIKLGTIQIDTGAISHFAEATAVNANGIAVGWVESAYQNAYQPANAAIRWDATGAPTRLLSPYSFSEYELSSAVAINASGTAVGFSGKSGYLQNGGVILPQVAMRWDSSSGAGTELLPAGISGLRRFQSEAHAINSAGTAVGEVVMYDTLDGVIVSLVQTRAFRWDATSNSGTELAVLGTSVNGTTKSNAYAISDAGTIAGYCQKFVSGTLVGNRAVIWLPDASVVDLNDLPIVTMGDSGSWLLTSASSISADGWVAGTGTFTPGAGDPYPRYWVAQVGLGGKWTSALTGNLNGTWGRGPQWSTGTPAMQVGDATFDVNAVYTVSLDRNEKTRSVTVSAGTVTLALYGYALDTMTGASIASGATLKVGSTGNAMMMGDMENSGALAPGAQIGTLHLVGNYTQSATGILQIDLASATSFDKFQVDNKFSSSGTLALSLLSGYMPAPGASFDILDWGSITGTFTNLQLPTLANGLQWDTSQLYTTGTLTVVATAIPGDFNTDGTVDARDYVVWRKGLGTTYTQSDYDTWRAHFGQTAISPSSLPEVAVPEPSSLPLVALISIARFLQKRRRPLTLTLH